MRAFQPGYLSTPDSPALLAAQASHQLGLPSRQVLEELYDLRQQVRSLNQGKGNDWGRNAWLAVSEALVAQLGYEASTAAGSRASFPSLAASQKAVVT